MVNLVAPVTASEEMTGIPWSISYCMAWAEEKIIHTIKKGHKIREVKESCCVPSCSWRHAYVCEGGGVVAAVDGRGAVGAQTVLREGADQLGELQRLLQC